MSYTQNQFGSELLQEINRGYDVVRLSRWAYSKYMSECQNLENGLREKIMQVVAMEEGPEFEMNESDLRSFAIKMRT